MNNTIEIYRSQDGSVQLNVKLENDTVWLNRQQMAELFGRDYKTVSKLKLDRYNELKDVVRLMGRAIGMQEKVSTDEYSGLFNVIPWFQSMFRMITRDFFVPLSPKSATTGLLSFQGDCFKRRLYHYLHKRNEKFY